MAVIMVSCLAFVLAGAGDDGPRGEPARMRDLLGCWEHGSAEIRIRFGPEKVVVHTADDDPGNPDLQVYRVKYETGRVLLRHGFEEIAWKVRLVEEGLLLEWPLWQGTFRRLEGVPPDIALTPAKVAPPRPLAPLRLEEIRRDLRRRILADKEVRANLERGLERVSRDGYARMLRNTTKNAAALQKTIADVGWIDAGRFGKEAARAAFVIVRHSTDLPLILAALPWVEKDVRAGFLDAGDFARLVDRSRLGIAEPQRYGTQILQDPKGRWVVAFLEDPDRVDEFRRELGLGPLAQEIEAFRASTGVKEVAIGRADAGGGG